MSTAIQLGVNVDHVATLRQARGTDYPSPVEAALCAEQAGADSITVHLREDRRHIQDADLDALKKRMTTRMNLEMAVTDEMQAIALTVRPEDACLVPEKRAELTTEGGLDVAQQTNKVSEICSALAEAGIRVSLFLDPSNAQLDAAVDVGAPVVELHTGAYAEASGAAQEREFKRIAAAAHYARDLGLTVHAGHGLHYENVVRIAAIPEVVELNIGHSIVARSVFDGIGEAVRRMRRLIDGARR